jgi:hypothetical protein
MRQASAAQRALAQAFGREFRMKRIALSRLLGLVALLALAAGLTTHPAQAVTVGVLPVGGSYSNTISSSGPTFTRDYNFELGAGTSNVSVLATGIGQTSGDFGVDLLELSLYDSANNLIASASGSPIVGFDSFAQSGLGLGAGAYLLSVFGQVTAGKNAFVAISLAANQIAATPIPAAGLMLLTGLGALGGLAARRRLTAKTGMAAA